MGLKLITILTVACIQLLRAQDPCVSKASLPDFAAPGRRISEQKCREYNWHRKRVAQCDASKGIEASKYPYMGAIGYTTDDKKLQFNCNAVLISPKFAVTTAHCVSGILNSTPELVRFGVNSLKTDAIKIDAEIAKIIKHPKYQARPRTYDIALIELETDLTLTKAVMPACLWSGPEIAREEAAIVPAWATSNKDTEYTGSEVLRAMKVQVVDAESCKKQMAGFISRAGLQIEDHQLCADDLLSDIVLCQGSSGGPLTTSVPLDGSTEDIMPYAHGITAFGISRCDHGITVHTRIASFVDWIESVVWPKAP